MQIDSHKTRKSPDMLIIDQDKLDNEKLHRKRSKRKFSFKFTKQYTGLMVMVLLGAAAVGSGVIISNQKTSYGSKAAVNEINLGTVEGVLRREKSYDLNGEHELRHYLVDKENNLASYQAVSSELVKTIPSMSWVKIESAREIDRKIHAGKVSFSPSQQQEVVDLQRNFLVVFIDHTVSGVFHDPVTTSQAMQNLRDNLPKLSSFFGQVGNDMSVSFVVYPEVITSTLEEVPTFDPWYMCSSSGLITTLDTLSNQDPGFNLDTYDSVMSIYPAGLCGGIGNGGHDPVSYSGRDFYSLNITDISFLSSWQPQSEALIAHEIGHNLRLNHASITNQGCPANLEIDECSFSNELAYGNVFDLMGAVINNPYGLRGLSSVALDQIGLLDAQIIESSNTYIVEPLYGSSVRPALKIPRGKTKWDIDEYIYIEARDPSGIDSSLPDEITDSLLILTGSERANIYEYGVGSALIDRIVNDVSTSSTPYDPAWYQNRQDAMFPVGTSFVDPKTGIEIKVGKNSAGKLTAEIILGSEAASLYRATAGTYDEFNTAAVLGSLSQPSLLGNYSINYRNNVLGDQSAVFQVVQAGDDVYETAAGQFLANNKSQFIGGGGSYTGLRFQNVTIPRNATVTEAYLEVYGVNGWIQLDMDIYGELIGDSAPFSSNNPPSSRRFTNTFVSHDSNTKWNDQEWVRVDEVTSIVNRLVNREYWNSGNDMSFIIVGNGGEFGRQSFYSYDHNANTAPRLVVNYTTDDQPQPTASPQPTNNPTSTPTPTPTPTPQPTNPPSGTAVQAEFKVSMAGDDVYETAAGQFQANNTSQYIGGGGSYTGLRFQNVSIPRNSTINSAYLEVFGRNGWIQLDMDIYGELNGDSSPFTTVDSPSSRRLTDTVVNHTSNSQWSDKQWVRVDEVTSIVNRLVNREYWNSGNDMSLIIVGKGGEYGRQSFYSYDYDANTAPKLVVNYSPPDSTQSDPTPPPLVTESGLTGEYYDGINFDQLLQTRTDSTIDFKWGSQDPLGGDNTDTFSVRWTGLVQAPASGTYEFATRSDDGVRLWIDNQLIIDNWTNHSATIDTGTFSLTAGQSYPIRLEFYDNAVFATMQLYWTRPGGSREIIGSQYLSTNSDSTTSGPASDPSPSNDPTSFGSFVVLNATYQADFNPSAHIIEASYCGYPLKTLDCIGEPGLCTDYKGDLRSRKWTRGDQAIEMWGAKGVPVNSNCQVTVRFTEDPGERILSTTVFNGVDQTRPIVPFWEGIGGSTYSYDLPISHNIWLQADRNQTLLCGMTARPAGINNSNGYHIYNDYFSHAYQVGDHVVHRLMRTPVIPRDDWFSGFSMHAWKTEPWAHMCYKMNVFPIYDGTEPVRSNIEPPLASPIPTIAPTSTPTPTQTPTPTATPTPNPSCNYESDGQILCAEPGLKAEYFDGINFEQLLTTRVDNEVNFDWGSFDPLGGNNTDTFSVRWTGAVYTQNTGTYTFITQSDDGVRLWIDNQLLIDNWTNHSVTTDRADIYLSGGRYYELKMEYYDNNMNATSKLFWTTPTIGGAIIDNQYLRSLYTPNGMTSPEICAAGEPEEYYDDECGCINIRCGQRIDVACWDRVIPPGLSSKPTQVTRADWPDGCGINYRPWNSNCTQQIKPLSTDELIQYTNWIWLPTNEERATSCSPNGSSGPWSTIPTEPTPPGN